MTKMATICGKWFKRGSESGVIFVWWAHTPSVCPNCQLLHPCCCGIQKKKMAMSLAKRITTLLSNPSSGAILDVSWASLEGRDAIVGLVGNVEGELGEIRQPGLLSGLTHLVQAFLFLLFVLYVAHPRGKVPEADVGVLRLKEKHRR